MEAAGAVKVTWAPVKQQTRSVHLLGTCRMGNDAATSVVDRYHRSHDIPNLFVCDGSSLVTSGRGLPTLTIQALASAPPSTSRTSRAATISSHSITWTHALDREQ